jgi:hypothetical protein
MVKGNERNRRRKAMAIKTMAIETKTIMWCYSDMK